MLDARDAILVSRSGDGLSANCLKTDIPRRRASKTLRISSLKVSGAAYAHTMPPAEPSSSPRYATSCPRTCSAALLDSGDPG